MCYRLHILNSRQLIRLFSFRCCVSESFFGSCPSPARAVQHFPFPPFWALRHLTKLLRLQAHILCLFLFLSSSSRCPPSCIEQPANAAVPCAERIASLRYFGWPSLICDRLPLPPLRWWVSLGHILRKQEASRFIKNIQTASPSLQPLLAPSTYPLSSLAGWLTN